MDSAGQDAILFAGIAVCAACLAQGRFSNSIILLTGELKSLRKQHKSDCGFNSLITYVPMQVRPSRGLCCLTIWAALGMASQSGSEFNPMVLKLLKRLYVFVTGADG